MSSPRKLSLSPGALGTGLGIQEGFLQKAAFHLDLSLQVGEDVIFKYQFICLLILKLFVESMETVGDC